MVVLHVTTHKHGLIPRKSVWKLLVEPTQLIKKKWDSPDRPLTVAWYGRIEKHLCLGTVKEKKLQKKIKERT